MKMVSAITLCFLALGLTAASSQFLSEDPEESLDVPISERRTFKHGKPKILPLVKKHKKFIAPHFFGKAPYDGPLIHDGPKFYKFHRYQGIEVKPAHDISYSTPEPFIESHSIEPPTGDYAPGFSHDHSFSSSSFSDHHSPSGGYFYDKPSISSSHGPAIFSPLPPQKPIISFLPAPQPVFPQPVPVQPAAISVEHSAPIPQPIFTPIQSNPLPPQPVFSVIPIKIQTPVIQPPAPVFSSIKIHQTASAVPALPAVPAVPAVPALPAVSAVPALPALPAVPVSTPAPAIAAPSPAPVIVKIPTPVLPAPTPAPILQTIPVVATPAPVFPAIPQFSLPAPVPSLPTFPSFQSIPASIAPEPEFPYPPSGGPIPSYNSLSDIEVKDHGLSTIEPEVSPIIDDGSKNSDHVLGAIKNDPGFFQKLKGWKADKANAALSHFAQFKPKPFFQSAITNTVPLEVPSVQFPGPIHHPLPLAPASVFPIFPPAQFHSPAKYESFPPNNIETPPLLNSYGVPIPHDTYAPPHISHERLSSAASEEEPAVVPAPENKEQTLQIPQKLRQTDKNEHRPVYIAEDNKNDNKTIEDAQPETEEYKTQKETIADDSQNYPSNHKEN